MKRAFLVIMVALFLSTFATANAEDDFQLRNNVRFGMTLTEVEELETLPRDKGKNENIFYYGYGTISNIDNSAVQYHFDGGKLKGLEIDFDALKKKATAMTKSDYYEISSKLQSKYGEPLGNTDGASHYLHGSEFDTFISSYSLWGMMGGQLIYEEWLIPVNDGSVKIDHVTLLGQPSCSHILEYTFFTQEEINQMTDDL